MVGIHDSVYVVQSAPALSQSMTRTSSGTIPDAMAAQCARKKAVRSPVPDSDPVSRAPALPVDADADADASGGVEVEVEEGTTGPTVVLHASPAVGGGPTMTLEENVTLWEQSVTVMGGRPASGIPGKVVVHILVVVGAYSVWQPLSPRTMRASPRVASGEEVVLVVFVAFDVRL